MTLLWMVLAGVAVAQTGEVRKPVGSLVAPHKHCGHPPAPCFSGGNVLCGYTGGLPVGPDLRVASVTCCHCGRIKKCRDKLAKRGIPEGHGPHFPLPKGSFTVRGRECSSWEAQSGWSLQGVLKPEFRIKWTPVTSGWEGPIPGSGTVPATDLSVGSWPE